MLNAGDLERSQRRLESRGKEVAERARQKAEKERLLAARQAARQAQREEEARQRRLAQAAAEEEDRRQHEEELEANNGVFYRATLTAVPAPESIAADKGIRRAADKILLPPSAGTSLMQQDAYKNGPMFFRLETAAGSFTHAGLLEFSAAEGFVALPLKVIRSLWGPNATEDDCAGRLKVSYRRLPTGERAVFQPRSAFFQQEHSCLTHGDWLSVRHGTSQYDLKICALQPEPACSVIDTDLEAEINPSIETEERIREEYEAAARRAEEAAAAAAAAMQAAEAEEAAAAEAAAKRERVRRAKEAGLPPEPPADSAEPLVTCLFRFPDGGRHSRRFPLAAPLQLLFDFVDSRGASSLDPGSYALVTQFPRRVFLPPAGGEGSSSAAGAAGAAAGQLGEQQREGAATLAAVGLSGPREVLFLEHRSGGSGGGNDTAAAAAATATAAGAASAQ
ncbi:Ubiquitin fusion degradation 1 [Chlorella sorokiniana]|uniref:Ubiquitin fusion degradation 1 n=1 Tax=Chlorella sorokiniana TaxID=3076 RepID=A0A2P6U2J1_CHLSO|nr:Ubiquitin fusion degradation 1 [Chlorella sorokiniana]|eukprot:PRW60527.1 Ubiquitin fusion degradation 1 [Chlorella sorokiniana]